MRLQTWSLVVTSASFAPACGDSGGGDPSTTSGPSGTTSAATPGTSGESDTAASTDPGAPTTSTSATSAPMDGTTDEPGTSNSSLPGPLCGNGVVDDGEACDDGNQDGDDGCDVACLPTGVPLWTVVSEPSSTILSVALDAAGNVFLAGYEDSEDEFYTDAIVRKLDADGNELLAFSFTGVDQVDDYARAIAVGPDGSFYVAGEEGLLGFIGRGFIRKYDPAGQELWTYTQMSDNPDSGIVRGRGLAVDGGTIAAVLVDENASSLAATAHVLALDPAGQLLWSDATPDALYAFDLALTHEGDIVVAGGQFSGEGDDHDGLAIKYSPAGQELWRRTYLDQPGEDGKAYGLAVSAAGDIALVGEQFSEGGSGYDIWLARLDAAGTVVWAEVYEGVDGFDTGFAAAWRGDDIYVAGILYVEGEYDNRWVGRFAGGGSLVWTSSGDRANSNDGAFDIAASDAMIVAVGYESLDVYVNTQWIRAYQP